MKLWSAKKLTTTKIIATILPHLYCTKLLHTA